MRLTVTRVDLERAARGLVPADRVDDLWRALVAETNAGQAVRTEPETGRGGTRETEPPRGLDLSTVAWWGGTLLVIVAMLALVPLLMERYGRHVLLAAALLYGAAFAVAAWWLWFRARYETAGGLMATLAVCMAPAVVLGVMVSAGLAHPDGGLPTGGGIAMELAAVAAGLAALAAIRFTFLLVPVIVAVWIFVYDAPLDLWGYDCTEGDACAAISFWYGVVLVGAAYAMDHLLRDDYAFWGYFFGALGMTVSLFLLAFLVRDSDALRAVFALVCVGMVLFAMVVRRDVFVVFGTIGVLAYLLYLIWDLFEGSLVFPLVLSAVGVALVFAGVRWHRRRGAMLHAVQARLPPFVRRLQPPLREE